MQKLNRRGLQKKRKWPNQTSFHILRGVKNSCVCFKHYRTFRYAMDHILPAQQILIHYTVSFVRNVNFRRTNKLRIPPLPLVQGGLFLVLISHIVINWNMWLRVLAVVVIVIGYNVMQCHMAPLNPLAWIRFLGIQYFLFKSENDVN